MSGPSEVAATRLIRGIVVPAFFYGTAWKEEQTARLVERAVEVGFRGFDTANQRRHYDEAGLGEGLEKARESLGIRRDALFLQTKFTYREGQDDRLPYDPRADYPMQVRQSFESSLEHLGVEQMDSFLLHGPRVRTGLSAGDLEVWRAMEQLHEEGRVRLIGVSNMSAEQLATLCESASVQPAFVQNRCFARLGWDREVRSVCRSEGVVYQGFSLLTANVAELELPEVREIAARHEATPAQVVFRFALQLGMICLTGTTDPLHMKEDLAVFDMELSDEEMRTVERLSG